MQQQPAQQGAGGDAAGLVFQVGFDSRGEAPIGTTLPEMPVPEDAAFERRSFFAGKGGIVSASAAANLDASRRAGGRDGAGDRELPVPPGDPERHCFSPPSLRMAARMACMATASNVTRRPARKTGMA
ncbi:MAG: hypothetical protein K2X74_00560 [Acetobacteraceae bacterium]|nr:hypothetical protein [Acetobacteraceae bacterium]